MQFKTVLPHLIAIVVFYLVSCITFAPEFSGKTLVGGDKKAYQGASKESSDYSRELEERQNWTGTTFSGMPNYQILKITEGNQLIKLTSIFRGFMTGATGVFFAGMLCAYLMFIIVGVNPWLSIAGAIGVSLATNNLVLWHAGHATKVYTIFYFPLITAGLMIAYNRRYLLGALLFAFGMGMAILANHPQMLYYFGITVPLYGLAQLVKAVRTKTYVHFLKASGALVVALLIAIGSGANILLPTQEYTAQTMRGQSVLETPLNNTAGLLQDTGEDKPAKSGKGGGLAWNYAMQWSNGFKDMLGTYAPMAAGGGARETVTKDDEFAKALRKLGLRLPGKEISAPLYHGVLPFTEGPSYLGAVVWALFLFGIFSARRSLTVWLAGGTLLILLMSAGSNLYGFNRFLFENLPLLNKFRTPNSALSVSAYMMLTLGIFGVHNWLKTLDVDREKARRQLLYSGVTAAALGLFVALVLPNLLDWSGPNDLQYAQRYAEYVQGQMNNDVFLDGLEASRRSAYSGDAWRSFLFVGLTFGALFLVFAGRISQLIAATILGGLLVTDYAGVNSRYITDADWVRLKSTLNRIRANAADEQILQDPDIHYRVLNTTTNTFNDSETSYFHRSIGGYSAVKLRRYQDLIDGYLLKSDQDVINMLNTKYFIVQGQNGEPEARVNPGAYGPAWLVNDIERVSTNDAEFAALGTVPDLKSTAIVHDEYADAVAGLNPTGEGQITITQYQPDELVYTFNSSSEQLVVFSEVWYGPDLGWNVYIDGEPAELFRVNYILRGLRVPAGQHEIRMAFEPTAYSLGVTLSWICSLLIIFGLVGYAAYAYLQRRDVENTAVPVEDMPRKKK